MYFPSILHIDCKNRILHTLRGFSFEDIAYDWLYRYAKYAIRHKIVSPFRLSRVKRQRFVEGVDGWQHVRWSYINTPWELELWNKRVKGETWTRP